jgi:hypothetical protein
MLPTDICPTYIELGGYTIVDALKDAAHVLRSPKTTVLSIQTLNVANYEDGVMDFVLLELFDTLSALRETGGSGKEEETEELCWWPSYHDEQPETVLSEDMTLFLGRLSHCTLEVFTQVSSTHVVIENCRVDGLTCNIPQISTHSVGYQPLWRSQQSYTELGGFRDSSAELSGLQR